MDVWILTFLLIFVRIGALMHTLPVVSAVGVPRSVPIMLSIALSAVLLVHVEPVALSADRTFIGAVVLEAATGAAAGMVVRAVFAAASIASELMSMQMGLQMALLFDPMMKTQQGPVASVANWVAGLLFLSADLHVHCLLALAEGLDAMPPGAALIEAPHLSLLVDATEHAFSLGLQLSGPVLALVFLTNTLVGILGKIAPRMNVFFSVGPTLSSLGGIALLAYALPAFAHGLIDAVAVFVGRATVLLGL